MELRDLYDIADDSVVTLDKNRVYDVWEDTADIVTGYYCSNTASKSENPDGMRRLALYLKAKRNVTIDGNGATVMCHGRITPLIFDRCSNITLKNLTVDYARPTMSEFDVIERNNGVCILKINPESLYEIRGNELFWLGEKGKNGKPLWEFPYRGVNMLSMYYRRDSGELLMLDSDGECCRPSVPTFSAVEEIGKNLLKVTLKDRDALLPVGCTVQSRCIVRDQVGGFFERCENLVFENLRIKAMHGLGLLSQYCTNVTFRGCDLSPDAGRTAASNADYFQFSGCRGHILIEGNKAMGAHDDFINVHGTYLQVQSVDAGKKRITVRFMNSQSWGFKAFEAGDTVDFVKWNTLVPYCSAVVKAVERLSDTDILLTLDRVPGCIEVGKDVVENATYTPGVTVRNNYVGYTAGRGALTTTRGKVLIENNVFDKTCNQALLIESDCNFWFESGRATEVIFRNNKVVGCGYGFKRQGVSVIKSSPNVRDGQSTEFVHGRLEISGNTFESSPTGEYAFKIGYCREFVLKGNVFDAPYKIETKTVGAVVDENNKVKEKL